MIGIPLPYPSNFGFCLVLEGEQLRFVESHISRKTSEIWGTRPLLSGKSLKRLPLFQQSYDREG
jgi:hypothetical protein